MQLPTDQQLHQKEQVFQTVINTCVGEKNHSHILSKTGFKSLTIYIILKSPSITHGYKTCSNGVLVHKGDLQGERSEANALVHGSIFFTRMAKSLLEVFSKPNTQNPAILNFTVQFKEYFLPFPSISTLTNSP